jgi:nucleotide-binding universal stress UspA family protein
MQHLLVPTDFSANARNALDYAMQLAIKLGSSITIYHACQVPASGMPRPAPSIIEQEKKTILLETRRKLRLMCEKARETGTTCFSESSVTPVTEGITDIAKQTGAGLIVMGTRGTGGISKQPFGNTTSSIMQSSHIPVLAIPGTAAFRPIEKIVFATDNRDSDFTFIGKLVHLARGFESELSIIDVQVKNGAVNSEALLASFRERVYDNFDYERISFHLIEDANIIDVIRNLSDNNGATIFSLASKKGLFDRIFSKSTAMEMNYITKIPLLTFNS